MQRERGERKAEAEARAARGREIVRRAYAEGRLTDAPREPQTQEEWESFWSTLPEGTRDFFRRRLDTGETVDYGQWLFRDWPRQPKGNLPPGAY